MNNKLSSVFVVVLTLSSGVFGGVTEGSSQQEGERLNCQNSSCGLFAKCRMVPWIDGDWPACSCLYKGKPPVCQPECLLNTDCASEKACIQHHCVDPCPGSCGLQAECGVKHHTPTCTCPSGMEGDPFILCRSIVEGSPIEEGLVQGMSRV